MGWLDSIASTGNQLISNFYNTQATSGEREHQYQMTDYLQSIDLENWNRQNEYNSPAKQMERFTSAGLNPHLIYGQGNPGNASPVPPSKMGSGPSNRMTAQPSQLDWQDIQIKKAQKDLLTEELNTKQIENVGKVLDIFWNMGLQNPANFPGKYSDIFSDYGDLRKYSPDTNFTGPGIKDYSLDAARENVRRIRETVANIMANTEYTGQKSAWQKGLTEEYENTGINRNRDDYTTRKLNEFFSGEGTIGLLGLQKLLDILVKFK